MEPWILQSPAGLSATLPLLTQQFFSSSQTQGTYLITRIHRRECLVGGAYKDCRLRDRRIWIAALIGSFTASYSVVFICFCFDFPVANNVSRSPTRILEGFAQM